MERDLYRVNAGAALAHEGTVLAGGTDVELPAHVAHEVRHLVTPIDRATGKPRSWQPADAALRDELARSRPHERVSILDAALKATRGDIAELEQLLAQAKREDADAAKAAAKATKPAAAADAK